MNQLSHLHLSCAGKTWTKSVKLLSLNIFFLQIDLKESLKSLVKKMFSFLKFGLKINMKIQLLYSFQNFWKLIFKKASSEQAF